MDSKEQVIEDIMLILENDSRAYHEIQAAGQDLDLTELAQFIQYYYEQQILGAMPQSPADHRASVGTLLIAQICLGWGDDVFYEIARRFEVVKV